MREPLSEPFVAMSDDGYRTLTTAIQEARQEAILKQQVLREVAVKDKDVTRKGQFSRVLAVDQDTGRVMFPLEADPPKLGSPSYVLITNPLQFKESIRAGMRIDVFEDGEWSSGSGLSLSPNFALSCYHVCNGKGIYRAMNGVQIPCEVFSFPEKSRYHLEYVTGSPDTAQGVDGALMKISMSDDLFAEPQNPKLKPKFNYFLLPCSPTYTNGVGIVSYPATTSFLLRAHQELIDGVVQSGTGSVWDVYRNSMTEELEDTRLQLQRQRKNVSLAETYVKKLLFRKLMLIFCPHVTGNLVISLGNWEPGQGHVAKTTCSTLHGSSGGAVCSFSRAKSGYFEAWHRGATADCLANEAVTCDDPWFVSTYFRYVLGDLPAPTDLVWKGWDLEPFYLWIQKHKAGQQVSGRAKAWTESVVWFHPKRRKLT